MGFDFYFQFSRKGVLGINTLLYILCIHTYICMYSQCTYVYLFSLMEILPTYDVQYILYFNYL